MRKSEQQLINNKVLEAVKHYNESSEKVIKSKQLRTCSASVAETDSYYVLTSYKTVIAIIEKTTDTLYDFLRYVYGYTNTSGHHISKFSKDYGDGKWGCIKVLTYRDI